ncbi:MAG: prkC 33, partial [Armatimonadetes bacterium]|nr:prkC 33 [Armatimonadota bacterium]
MRLTMKVIQGPHRHEVFEFQAPATFAVGRGVDCAVPLPKDGLCTRQHLIVDLSPEGCVLNHKGRHDTFVNGVKVSESCILAEQATIRFGRTTIHAELLPAATTAPIPPPVHRGHSAAAQSDDLTEMASFPDLENYEYLQALGQGSAGWVCHMRHRHTGQQVAMKVLKPSRDPLQWKRFKEERRVLEGLNHPHVARFVGGGEKNGAWYHLLEYIAGPNLRGLRESRADGLSPREAVTIMVQALEGLHHVHECGILHRDIKPENIVVEGQWPDYRAVVTDFGFGKIEAGPQNPAGETLTLPDTVMGTLPFMQPDLLFGRPRDA